MESTLSFQQTIQLCTLNYGCCKLCVKLKGFQHLNVHELINTSLLRALLHVIKEPSWDFSILNSGHQETRTFPCSWIPCLLDPPVFGPYVPLCYLHAYSGASS